MDALSTITFALAYAGYLGLCATAVSHAAGRPARRLGVVTAAVVAAHVLLVWHTRYQWSPSAALAAGLVPVVVFHAALAAILAATVAPAPWYRVLTGFAVAAVTAGALGAVFGRAVVAGYRWPVVIAAALTGIAVVVLQMRSRLGSTGHTTADAPR